MILKSNLQICPDTVIRPKVKKFKFIAVLMLWAALPLTFADDTPSDSDRIEFIIGNLVFVTLHEFSHLIIQDFNVPVLGNSEDAADTLAAVTLIRADREEPERSYRLLRMLLTAADANRILWERGVERDNPATYLARHPLSVQRAARIVCLAYGSDMELLEPLPDIVGLPEFRAFWCDEEYENAEAAWMWVMESIVPKSTGSTTTDHKVVYGRTEDSHATAIRERLMQNKALERVIGRVENSMLLTEAITLRTASCGSPDAYWDGNVRDLVLCYELIQAYEQLAKEQSINEIEKIIRAFHLEERADSTL